MEFQREDKEQYGGGGARKWKESKAWRKQTGNEVLGKEAGYILRDKNKTKFKRPVDNGAETNCNRTPLSI